MINQYSVRSQYGIGLCIILPIFSLLALFTSAFAASAHKESSAPPTTRFLVQDEISACQSYRGNGPHTIRKALVVGDSLFNSQSRFQPALLDGLATNNIDLSTFGYEHVVAGQGIDDLLAKLEQGLFDQELADVELFILNLGVNNWSNAINNLALLHSWIDQTIAYVITVNPELIILWVEPHAVQALVENQNVYTGTQLVADYLNQKDTDGEICLLDWSAYADANPDVYSTALADIDGVHMFGNEVKYANFIINNLVAYLLTGNSTLPGDTNCDGNFDAIDALFVLQHTVNIRTNLGQCPLIDSQTQINATVGDADQDGDITSIDALFLLQCVVDIANDFCPE